MKTKIDYKHSIDFLLEGIKYSKDTIKFIKNRFTNTHHTEKIITKQKNIIEDYRQALKLLRKAVKDV